ncbi:MAG: FliM/FliN family flagellar motor C-terminal domain-containing protein [Pseudomonadota bacterium]
MADEIDGLDPSAQLDDLSASLEGADTPGLDPLEAAADDGLGTPGLDVPGLDTPDLNTPGIDDLGVAPMDGLDPAPLSDLDPLAGGGLGAPSLDMPEAAPHQAAPRTGDSLLGLQRIQQLKVTVQAMLGTVPLSISELANLEKGDVIKLETKIGDPVLILANGDEIARAEIVVTQDQPPRFGLTLTEIIENSGPDAE